MPGPNSHAKAVYKRNKKNLVRLGQGRKAIMRRPRRRIVMARTLPIGGLPRTYLAKLRYSSQFTLDATDLVYDSKAFKLNSLYDPDNSLGGHQPYGFDQLMAYYSKFTVIACKATLSFVSSSGGAVSTPGYFAQIHNTSATVTASYANVDAFLEDPRAGPIRQTTWQYGAMPSKTNTITKYWRLKKWFGPSSVGNPDLKGTASADPASLVYAVACSAPINGNNPTIETFVMQMDYIALFTDPLLLPQS